MSFGGWADRQMTRTAHGRVQIRGWSERIKPLCHTFALRGLAYTRIREKEEFGP